MSYNIQRADDLKTVKTDTPNVEGDSFNTSREEFFSKPQEEKELGMDFLVDSSDEDEDQEVGEEVKEEYIQDDIFENSDFNKQQPGKSYEEIQQEKSYYLSQIKRLEKKGNVTSRRFTMEHSLEEIRGEVIRIKKEQSMDNSIDYLRQGLMFCVSTIEMADNTYNLGAQLGGWSQNVMGNIESYDEVFEELYEKYSSSLSVSPEIKLISMLAGSAFMFSLQKKLVNGGSNPVPTRQREMSGPSINTDELMEKLGEIDLDDISSISSSGSSVKISEEPAVKTINIPKKRGRPKKA